MSTALAEKLAPSTIERALIGGDLSRLNETERLSYYHNVCQSLGLNPLTKPFAYITLNGKLTLYALKDCTEQLRSTRKVSVQIVAREVVEDCYVVTARASMADRADESIGAVSIGGLKGEARANAMMKAETKAKRRVTLSICGLGMLDETEVETIPDRGGYTVEAPKEIPTQTTSGAPEPVNAAGFGAAGSLTIQSVEMRPTKNANVTKYIIVLSDGREVTTIKSQLGALAEQIAQDGDVVTVETKTTKWGEDLIGLSRVTREAEVLENELPEPPPLTDDDIPF